MKVIVTGTGYVGLVTGACFSETGLDVWCVDTDAAKIARLERGELPIHEPGLQEIVDRNTAAGRLRFTTRIAACSDRADVVFIAVGTPSGPSGEADTHYVEEAAREIGCSLTGPAVVVVKSTVPIGTTERIGRIILRELELRGAGFGIEMASNPEFLKEGRAVSDFRMPDRVVVGTRSNRARSVMEQLYRPFMRTRNRMLFTDPPTAEMIKYASNAMLATRISFMNEIANLCERVGADVDEVRRGIGADPRIGAKFLYAGCGYGGSCFPKDVRALIRTAEQNNCPMELLQAVERTNERQKVVPFEKLRAHFGGNPAGHTVGIWGLAFKPDTDDTREAPALSIIDRLLAAGCRVRAYDPAAMEHLRHTLGERIVLCNEMYAAAEGADALIVVTEWQQFRMPDWNRLRRAMRGPVLIDGRNIYDRRDPELAGFTVYRIG